MLYRRSGGTVFCLFPVFGGKGKPEEREGEKTLPRSRRKGSYAFSPRRRRRCRPLEGINPVKMGVDFALLRGDRLALCHGIFLAKKGEACRQSLSFDQSDPRLAAFLRGEELPCDPALQGYVSVCLHGVSLGFGKASGGRLKNKYPKGLRNNK